MPLVENGKNVLSKLDNQIYSKVNGQFKRHLIANNITEEEYLVKHELDILPKCVICGELPQLWVKWQWKNVCKNKECIHAVRHPKHTDERKAKTSKSMKALFADKEWANQHQAKMHQGNQSIGEDGLTGYERTKVKREVTMLEKYGHAQYANWEKTKETWQNKSDEEKDLYAKETSERQLAFSLEKKQEITNRIVQHHLEKYGVACPANLHPQFGSSKIASSLFEALDTEGALFKPKSKELCVGRALADFAVGDKIIEFYGDYWHANPKKFKPDDLVGKGQWPAKTIWAKDAERIKKIEAAGYKVKIIWEKQFKRNPEKVIKECQEWLSNT